MKAAIGKTIIPGVAMLHSRRQEGAGEPRRAQPKRFQTHGPRANVLNDAAGFGSIADGLLGRDPVQPRHAAAHPAQSQMSAVAQDRSHLIGQPVDHE
jgi:hypothetical protein